MKIIQQVNRQGQVIRYEVDVDNPASELGFGGTGRVYKGIGINTATGARREVAIKFLDPELPNAALKRAKRETEINCRNDNLVEMIDFVDQVDEYGKHRYYVVSELLNGIMLFDLQKGKLKSRDGIVHENISMLYDMYRNERIKFAKFIVRNVLSGIMAMHDKGYIHRDIDPSNIMITIDGKVKLIDFGVAKDLSALNTQDRQLTAAGIFIGKASYAAPELARGDVAHQDFTTDIYAIGILFYQMITGELPFTGPVHEVLHKQLYNELPLKNIGSKQIRKVIEKATQKNQALRYKSAFELRVAIDQLKDEVDDSGWLTGKMWLLLCLGWILLFVLITGIAYLVI